MKTVPTVFENGVFRPIQRVDFPEGSNVDILVPEPGVDPLAKLKAKYPDTFGWLTPLEAQEMMEAIDEQFGRINPDAWK